MTNIDKHKLYQEFQEAFPLEKLGEMTLEQYTNLNRSDSFCYWLESKTDCFGSIGGDSAYIFGVFHRDIEHEDNPSFLHDENYTWRASLASDRDSAFERIKTAIIKIANAARNGDYEQIDDVSVFGEIFKWKIAFLYSDEKLLPIFKRQYLKDMAAALGRPFKEKTAFSKMQRYLISRQDNDDIYNFSFKLLELRNKKERYWLYAPGDRASQWQRCLETSTMCLGWDFLGDLAQYASKQRITKRLQEEYKMPDTSFKNDSLAIWSFLAEMKIGDIIFAKKGTGKIIGRGVVTSEYHFDPEALEFKNIRAVRWENIGEWDADHQLVQKLSLIHI